MNQEDSTSGVAVREQTLGNVDVSSIADSNSAYVGDLPLHNSPPLSLNTETSMDHSLQTIPLGYDFEFVPPVDAKYICPICMLVLRSPLQTECGHRFCAICIRRWLTQNTGGTECPNCKDKITSNQVFPDNFAKREIMNLTLKCPNAKNGCEMIVDLHHVQSHIDTACQYALCPCPNNCSDILLRKDLKQHVTVTCSKLWTTCNMCQEKIISGSYQSHLLTCRMAMDLCSHCGMKVLKNKLKSHQDMECPQVIVNCVFFPFGCPHKCIRESLSRHVETSVSDHLNLVSKIVMTLLQQGIALPSAPGTKSYDAPHSGSNYPVRSHKMDSSLVHALGTKLEGQKLSHELCDLMTNVADTGFDSSLSSPSLDSSRHRGPFGGAISAVEGSYDSPDVASADSATGSTDSRTSADDSRYSVTLHELRQNIMVLQQVLTQQAKRLAKLESLPDEIVARHCNGCYLWRIDNVEKHRQAAKSGSATALHSQGFYTSLYGYRICIRVNLNGIEKGFNKHVALFVHLMKGDYDEILDWPFNGLITLSILDQDKSIDGIRKDFTESLEANPNLTAFAKPTTSRNHKGFGYIEFAPLSLLDDPRFVKNSVLFIRATVRVADNLMMST